jgi:hypothetical protein
MFSGHGIARRHVATNTSSSEKVFPSRQPFKIRFNILCLRAHLRFQLNTVYPTRIGKSYSADLFQGAVDDDFLLRGVQLLDAALNQLPSVTSAYSSDDITLALMMVDCLLNFLTGWSVTVYMLCR